MLRRHACGLAFSLQVTPERALAPVELVRRALHDCMEALLGQLAGEVPAAGGAGGPTDPVAKVRTQGRQVAGKRKEEKGGL